MEIHAIFSLLFWLNLYISTFLGLQQIVCHLSLLTPSVLNSRFLKALGIFRKFMLLLATCFSKRFFSFSFLTYINFPLFPGTGFLLPIEHAGLSFAVCDVVWAEHTPSAKMGLHYPCVSWGGSWGEVSFCTPTLSAPTLLSVSPNPPQPGPAASSLVQAAVIPLPSFAGPCWRTLSLFVTGPIPAQSQDLVGQPFLASCAFSAFPSSASWPPSVSLLRALLGSCTLPPVGVTCCAGITA